MEKACYPQKLFEGVCVVTTRKANRRAKKDGSAAPRSGTSDTPECPRTGKVHAFRLRSPNSVRPQRPSMERDQAPIREGIHLEDETGWKGYRQARNEADAFTQDTHTVDYSKLLQATSLTKIKSHDRYMDQIRKSWSHGSRTWHLLNYATN